MEAARVETANLGLANAFGAVGDKCWNINRVMRLAGTKNLKTGRRAKVVADEPGRVYPIDQFRAAETPPVSPSGGPPRGGNRHGAPGGAGEDSPGPASVADLSELDRWRVPDRVRVIINQGHHPDQPKGDDNTRSAWLYDVVCNLLRCGVPDETILGIITDQSWAISESVLDKGRRAAQYAQRQIEEARAEIELEEADFKVDKHGVPYARGGVHRSCRAGTSSLMVGRGQEAVAKSRIIGHTFGGQGNRNRTIGACQALPHQRSPHRGIAQTTCFPC